RMCLLSRQRRPLSREPRERMAQREPVHVEHRLAGHFRLLQHALDEQVLLAAGSASEQPRAISYRLDADAGAEGAVAEAAQLAQEAVARQRQLQTFRAVEAEQERPRAPLSQLGEQELVLARRRAPLGGREPRAGPRGAAGGRDSSPGDPPPRAPPPPRDPARRRPPRRPAVAALRG